MADKNANKGKPKSENDLIPENIPSEEDISKYVEQLGRYEGTPKPPDTTYSDIGEYLNQRGEYKGSPVPSLDVSKEQISKYIEGLGNYQGTTTPQLNVGQDKIAEYVNNLEGYTGKQEGSFEGTPVVHTNFKGAIDAEYINPDLVPVDIVKDTTNMTPFRKQGSIGLAPGLKANTDLPTFPTVSGYTMVDITKFQLDRDNKEVTLIVYNENSGVRTKMFITPYWNPSELFANCRVDKAYASWISEWLEITEYHTTTLDAVPTNNTMTLSSVDATCDSLHYFKGWFILNTDWTRDVANRYQYVTGFDHTTNTITTMGALGHTTSANNWEAGDTIELVRFPVRSHYKLDDNYVGDTNNFTARPTSYISRLNELRMACGKDDRPLLLTDIKERKYFGDSEKTLTYFSSVSSIIVTNYGSGYNEVPNMTGAITSGGGSGATATVRMIPLASQIDLTTSGWTGGTGYAVGDIIELVSGTPVNNKVKAVVDGIGGGGAITSINLMTSSDYDLYTVIPTYSNAAHWTWTTITGGGSDAKIRFDWGVWEVVLTSGGTGYTSAPTVTIPASAAGWTAPVQATATAYLGSSATVTGDLIGMNYDGIWFDFASIPQTLKSSGSTAFNRNLSISSEVLYLNPDCSLTKTPTTNCIKIIPVESGSWRIATSKRKNTIASPSPWTAPNYAPLDYDAGYSIIGINAYPYTPTFGGNVVDFHIVFAKAVGVSGTLGDFANRTLNNLKSALESVAAAGPFRSRFYLNIVGDGNTKFDAYDSTTTVNSEELIQASVIGESSVSTTSFNKFLGCYVDIHSHGTTTPSGSTYKNTILLSCVIDNRNEILVTQGTYEPAQGFDIGFNLWFSRRITGFNFYNKNITSTLSGWDGYFTKIDKYPYFKWLKDTPITTDEPIYINETPLFAAYSIKSMIGENSAEYSNKYLQVDKANAYNCYKWTYQYSKFYTTFKYITPNTYVDTRESGLGLKWIVNTNRYIDQDTSMNYTKAVFVGQTNGRYFISGCKNEIEYEVLENDDMLFCNNYAVGVSQYDTFLRNSSINVQVGDKDIIRNISNYGGYLTVAKDTNSYVLDVNTDDELKYRVVDTMNGRGTVFGDSMCETPYGIIMPTYDGVWLMNPSGVNIITSNANCRMSLYKSTFASAAKVQSVYYSKYNEVMIFMHVTGDTDNIYVFTYNFSYKFWTNYSYATTAMIRALTDANRDVLLVTTTPAVFELDEDKLTNTTKPWVFQTHNMPYGTRFKEIHSSWLTLSIDYGKANTTDRGTLTITPYKDGTAQTDITMKVDNTLYLKTDGTFVSSSPGTHYLSFTNNTNGIIGLSIVLGSTTSITKISANTYEITVRNTVTTLQEVKDLIDGLATGLTTGSGGTPSLVAFTGPATKQSATFMKNSYTDCLLDFPITIGSPAKTLSFKIVGTNFNLFNINGVYVWINTQNRLPNLR